MSRKGKVWLFSGMIAAAAAVVIGSWSSEPRYQGRSLTRWLEQGSEASLDQAQKIAQAHKAINAIGAEKALPILMNMVRARDGKLRSWIILKNRNWNVRALKRREAAETQQLGVAGFEALGTNGAPAIPELARLLDDKDHAFIALRCLVCIGVPAEGPVCQALTNSSVEIRRFAASQLACVTDDMEVYLAHLRLPLEDLDGSVRFAAVEAVGWQTAYPDEAIPILAAALQDPDGHVSSHAAKVLENFGTNALRAFGALSNAVRSASEPTSQRSLRTMIAIAPKEALPVVMENVRSAVTRRRSFGVAMLGNYREAPAEVITALKEALQDSDSRVTQNAKMSSLKLREAIQKNRGKEVRIPNEPSCEGKELGYWLKKCRGVETVPEDAQKALRQIGTNAIPALLERLVYKDPWFGLEDFEVSIGGVIGFAVIGEPGAPALPRLEEIMNREDERVALLALMASCNLGMKAMPVLTRALTNRNEEVRNQAVGLFSDEPTRLFPEARKKAVPTLVSLLDDSSEMVRMITTNVLKEIDPVAAARAGVKWRTHPKPQGLQGFNVLKQALFLSALDCDTPHLRGLSHVSRRRPSGYDRGRGPVF